MRSSRTPSSSRMAAISSTSLRYKPSKCDIASSPLGIVGVGPGLAVGVAVALDGAAPLGSTDRVGAGERSGDSSGVERLVEALCVGAVVGTASAVGVGRGSTVSVSRPATSSADIQPLRAERVVRHNSAARVCFPTLGMGHPPSFFLISLLKRTLRLQRPADRGPRSWGRIRRCTRRKDRRGCGIPWGSRTGCNAER